MATTAFISKVARESGHSESDSAMGPGAYYADESKQPLPGFIPFGTSAKRSQIDQPNGAPAIGLYNIEKSMIAKACASAASFRARSKRFEKANSSLEAAAVEPGPGTYILKSEFDGGRQKKREKPKNPLDEIGIRPVLQAPSIPTRFQSFGYELGNNGKLVLQDSPGAGYSGVKGDTVGPGDYEPTELLHRKGGADFGRASERRLELGRASIAPGPGYYNAPISCFGPIDGSDNDTDIVVQLRARRAKQSASFESRTERDLLMQEARRKAGPGPGRYDLTSPATVDPVPVELQYYSRGSARFGDPNPRSMRLYTSPGDYNPLTSDFERTKIKLMKRKKMHSRSGWAQNISFDATESRFFEPTRVLPPGPGEYALKEGIADRAPQPNPRGGAFGAKDERFKEPKAANNVRFGEQAAAEVERNLSGGNSSLVRPEGPEIGGQAPRKAASTFESRSQGRKFRELERSVPFPAPGAYNTQPKWENARGVLPMVPPSVVVSDQRAEKSMSPGPGQYKAFKGIGDEVAPNRKNIFLTTAPRGAKYERDVPGPGVYNPVPLSGSMIKPSFNAAFTNN